MAEDKPAAEATRPAPAGKDTKTRAASEHAPRRPPLVIGLYVGVVLVAAAFTERVLVPWAQGRAAPAGAAALAADPHTSGEAANHEGGEAAAAGGSVYVIEDLVVNPAASGGLRYLAASVGLQSNHPSFLEEMKTRDTPIKDALIRILGSKTVDQLADIDARETMRSEILQEVDRLVPEQRVDAIYFTRFVLQ